MKALKYFFLLQDKEYWHLDLGKNSVWHHYLLYRFSLPGTFMLLFWCGLLRTLGVRTWNKKVEYLLGTSSRFLGTCLWRVPALLMFIWGMGGQGWQTLNLHRLNKYLLSPSFDAEDRAVNKLTSWNLLSFFFFNINLFYLFIFGCVGLRCCTWAFSSVASGGFSLQWLLSLQSTGSRRMGFSSCGTRASVVVARGL